MQAMDELLLDKIYDAEFGYYRVGNFFIQPQDSETFPYFVLNREGAILYKAESLPDAVEWADSRHFADGGSIGQEIVVITKESYKDGGKQHKFRFLVYEEDENEAKKIAATLWEKSFSDLDLSVVEILTDAETRKKYEQGGLVSVDEMMSWTSEKLKEILAKYQTQLEKIDKIYSPTVSEFAEYSGLKNQVKEIKNILLSRNETFKKGGKVKRVRFIDKVESISERLEGTKVPDKLKKDYGARYSRDEAVEAAKRIAGAQLRDRKMATGGFLSFPATGNFIKLSDYYKTLPDKNLLVGLRVYDEINEEYIYIKSVEDGLFAGEKKNDDFGFYYDSMRYLLVNKKDLPN